MEVLYFVKYHGQSGEDKFIIITMADIMDIIRDIMDMANSYMGRVLKINRYMFVVVQFYVERVKFYQFCSFLYFV